jgi:hypothetical protein
MYWCEQSNLESSMMISFRFLIIKELISSPFNLIHKFVSILLHVTFSCSKSGHRNEKLRRVPYVLERLISRRFGKISNKAYGRELYEFIGADTETSNDKIQSIRASFVFRGKEL